MNIAGFPSRYRCWAEVDLTALRENLLWIRNQVGPNVKIMTVVKADAYGHGLRQTAALLMQSGTDVFGVANLEEARTIRTVGRGWPVLMLGACLPEEVPLAVRDDVMPTVSTRPEAERFSREAVDQGKVAKIHLKVDTGMGRLGVEPSEAWELIEAVRGLPGLQLHGVYTHYSSVEDDPAYSRRQAVEFTQLVARARARGIEIPLVHANSSGALLLQPDTMFNLIRPGLVVYGVAPRGERPQASDLPQQVRAALSFKCRVSLVKTVAAGKGLSYGHTFVSPAPMRVATLTAGYGDGYLRAASNRASVLIRGRRCRVLGRVTMDQTIVDVSGVSDAAEGDEAVLIGRQGNDEITATELAQWMGTIPWEVLTCITYRVPRLYLGGHAS